MRVNRGMPERMVHGVAVAATAVAALLLMGWWAGQARASHNPEATLHACVAANGTLTVAEQCKKKSTEVVLATEAGLDATDARLEALHARVGALLQQVTALEETVEAQATTIADLHGRLAGVSREGSTLRFDGINVQVTNGGGATHVTNGLGNLIVGYGEDHTTTGCVPSPGDCQYRGDGASDARTGSHNLLVGVDHSFSGYGGIVAGLNNTATAPFASVTGGTRNTASGLSASVSGGQSNTASFEVASVSGGTAGTASGHGASVSGGQGNTASGPLALVAGGRGNTASGLGTSVLGGSGQSLSSTDGCHPSCM